MSKHTTMIDTLTKKMNERLKDYRTNPKDELELLNYIRTFYKYSLKNALLIESQYEGAIGVASYKEHKEKGYHVQKGQTAIRVLAPKLQDMFIDEKKVKKPLKYATQVQKQKIQAKQLTVIKKDLRGYVPVPVFDITQTDCPEQDYPNLYPNRPQNFTFEGTDQEFSHFYQAVRDYADAQQIPVSYGVMSDSVRKGYYAPLKNKIVLREGLIKQEQAKVLLHELAHAKMHTVDKMKDKESALRSSSIIEYQAEMTAYLISSSFNLDTEDYSTRYLKSWTSKEAIEPDVYVQSLEEVKATTKDMIEQIVDRYNERQLEQENAVTLTDPHAFKHYIDTLYNHYDQAEIVVFLNEQMAVIDSTLIFPNSEQGGKLPLIVDKAETLASHHIVYLNKETKLTDGQVLEAFTKAPMIQKQLSEKNVSLADYFVATKDSLHSYQMKQVNDQSKTEKSSFKKLLDQPQQKRRESQNKSHVIKQLYR